MSAEVQDTEASGEILLIEKRFMPPQPDDSPFALPSEQFPHQTHTTTHMNQTTPKQTPVARPTAWELLEMAMMEDEDMRADRPTGIERLRAELDLSPSDETPLQVANGRR